MPSGSCNNAAAGQYYTGSGGTNQGGCSTDTCNAIADDKYYTDSGTSAGTTATCSSADCVTPAAGKYFVSSGTTSSNCGVGDCNNLPAQFATYQSGFATSSRTNIDDCAFKCTAPDTGCSGGCAECMFFAAVSCQPHVFVLAATTTGTGSGQCGGVCGKNDACIHWCVACGGVRAELTGARTGQPPWFL